MSKIFRDLESLGKSIGKKWSHILLLIKGVKSPRKKRIRRLYKKDQEVIQQGSGGYTTRIRRLYNKDQEVFLQDFFWYQCSATIRIG
jgi:hypothetical protein